MTEKNDTAVGTMLADLVAPSEKILKALAGFADIGNKIDWTYDFPSLTNALKMTVFTEHFKELEALGRNIAQMFSAHTVLLEQAREAEALGRNMAQMLSAYNASLDFSRMTSAMIWAGHEALAEPPARIELVEVDDAVTLSDIQRALASGKLSRAALLSLLTDGQGSKRGPQAPPMEIQIRLVEHFEELRYKRGRSFTQERFVLSYADKIYACSLASFKRYYKNVKRHRKLELL
jgi:hypothetical protein